MSVSAPKPISGVTVRFGIYEFNLKTGELRKCGLPISRAPQPAQILCLLVSRAGELVSREEISETVCGKETFVDFEQGLNHCIKQIRTALGDERDSGLYIEPCAAAATGLWLPSPSSRRHPRSTTSPKRRHWLRCRGPRNLPPRLPFPAPRTPPRLASLGVARCGNRGSHRIDLRPAHLWRRAPRAPQIHPSTGTKDDHRQLQHRFGTLAERPLFRIPGG